ncbi:MULTISPECIES: hypothetical protein [Leeuwenhoekiella]|uniref:hypothetical protein n=1 Tax=Leeuwenhoekiella TaxID=283735 RepID=UPI003009F4F9|tara:strand:+ start:2506 stop:6072 length:3567 start_codon:yes stop_codon:yes gene_type:complete
MKKLLLIFFVAVSGKFYAQVEDDSFDPAAESTRLVSVPNSPESQAFQKYGNTPVDLYTGKPSVEVPIYIFKGRELDLPISLSYDGSAIKVEQKATNVGLGWNLNVGGRISRIVNGLPDDFILNSHTYGPYKTFWDSEVRSKIASYKNLGYSPTFSSKQALIDYLRFLKKTNDNEYDTQSDYYSFNALGRNDMIVIDNSSLLPKTLNNPRIKVSLTKTFQEAKTPIEKWVITMDDGTKFTFEEFEKTKDTNLNDSQQFSIYGFKKEYVSTWLLTELESANGKDVYEFIYTDVGYTESRPASISGVTNVIAMEGGGAPSQVPTPTNVIGFNDTYYQINEKALTTIKHNGRRIIKIDIGTRWDTDIDNAVESIKVFNEDTGNDTNDLIKEFSFQYDYFRTSSAHAPPYSASNTPTMEWVRLKLDQIDIKNNQNQTLSNYSFEYDNPYSLSSTSSYAQDYYGYYNGVSSNSVLYPKYSHAYIPNNGANRDPSFSDTKKGILTKIKYPTRGFTEFEYEANYEQEVTGSTTSWNLVSMLSLNNPQLPLLNTNACNSIHYNNGEITPATTSAVFTVNEDDTDFRLTYSQNQKFPKFFTAEKIINIIKIPDSNSSLTWSDIYNDNCNAELGVDVVWNSGQWYNDGWGAIYNNPKEFLVNLDQGTYQLVLANPQSNISNTVSLEEEETIESYAYNPKAGIRIKSITDYTSLNNFSSKRTFHYPSGRVISNPRYTYTSYQYSTNNSGVVEVSQILTRMSHASGTDKPHIGYDEVVETFVDESNSENNGQVIHEFNTAHYGSYFNGAYTYFIGDKEAATNYRVDYELGKSKATSYYNSNDDILKKNSTSYFDEEFYSNSGIYLHIDESKNVLYPTPAQDPGGNWYINFLPGDRVPTNQGGTITLMRPCECNDQNFITATNNNELCQPAIGRLVLNKTTAWGKFGASTATREIQYFNSEEDLSTATNYEYYLESSNPNKPGVIIPGTYQLKNTSTTESNGDVIEKEYLYAEHSSNTGNLQSKNMVNIPVETIVSKNGSPVSSKKYYYSTQTANGTQPEKVQASKGALTYEDRVFFEEYVDGNCVQIRLKNGSPVSYLWGYNGQYPIAKIENATITEVESQIGAVENIDESDLSVINNLRNTLPNAMITTYEYSPLEGVTKITDARGISITYEYGDFSRLKTVLDNDMKLLQEYKYHYKNQ